MIKDPYLRKIVEQSGKREITTAMVVQAEKEKADFYYTWEPGTPEKYREALAEQMAAQQNMGPFFQGIAAQGFSGPAGAIFGYYSRCPYCGR